MSLTDNVISRFRHEKTHPEHDSTTTQNFTPIGCTTGCRDICPFPDKKRYTDRLQKSKYEHQTIYPSHTTAWRVKSDITMTTLTLRRCVAKLIQPFDFLMFWFVMSLNVILNCQVLTVAFS